MKTPRDLPTVELSLRDGTPALIRPMVADDRELIVEGLEHLSMGARIARFGMAIDHLSSAELDYLTQVDQRHHVAWGAIVDGVPAGSARYILLPDEECAEVAIVVVDEFRGRGLGRLLLEALASSARHNGVTRFCFMIEPANQVVRSMVSGLGAELSEESGLVKGSLWVRDLATGRHGADFEALLVTAQDSVAD